MRKSREPNDKLDRATDRTVAEAGRKSLRGLCRYSKLERYGGLPVFKALKVSVAILNLIRVVFAYPFHFGKSGFSAYFSRQIWISGFYPDFLCRSA